MTPYDIAVDQRIETGRLSFICILCAYSAGYNLYKAGTLTNQYLPILYSFLANYCHHALVL